MEHRALLLATSMALLAACASSRAPDATSPGVAGASRAAASGAEVERFSAAPPSPEVSSEPREEAKRASTADDARADLESARATLREGERFLLVMGESRRSDDAPPSSSAGTRAEKPVAQAPRARPAAAGPAKAAEAGGVEDEAAQTRTSRCAVACKALGSMRRAAERVCDLLGTTDAECVDARSRVERSGSLVARACPTCSAAQ